MTWKDLAEEIAKMSKEEQLMDVRTLHDEDTRLYVAAYVDKVDPEMDSDIEDLPEANTPYIVVS